MSRSFKKEPVVNDHKRKSTKKNKQIANRRVRRINKKLTSISPRSYHKRMTETWDITDYAWRWTQRQAVQEYVDGSLSEYIYEHYPSLEAWLDYWERCCKRK